MTRATSRRGRQINICVTEAEYDRLKSAAHGSALSMSSYVRRKALRGAQRDVSQEQPAGEDGEQTEVSA